jgi:hypothetical protein
VSNDPLSTRRRLAGRSAMEEGAHYLTSHSLRETDHQQQANDCDCGDQLEDVIARAHSTFTHMMHGFEQVVVGEAGASRSRAAHQRRELISCARAMIIAARRPGCHFGSCSGRTGRLGCTPGLAAVEPGISLVTR